MPRSPIFSFVSPAAVPFSFSPSDLFSVSLAFTGVILPVSFIAISDEEITSFSSEPASNEIPHDSLYIPSSIVTSSAEEELLENPVLKLLLPDM